MEKFNCKNCRKEVSMEAVGTKNRNHCPFCLYSSHVDDRVGDRKAKCDGLMEPIGLTTKKDGEIKIVHVCQRCDKVSANRIAGDDLEEEIINIQKTQNPKEIKKLGLEPLEDENRLRKYLFGEGEICL